MKLGSAADIVPALLFAVVFAPLLLVGQYVQRLTSYTLSRKVALSSAAIGQSPNSDRFVLKLGDHSAEFNPKQLDRAKSDDPFVYELWGSLYLNSGAELRDQQPIAIAGFAGLVIVGSVVIVIVKRRKSAE